MGVMKRILITLSGESACIWFTGALDALCPPAPPRQNKPMGHAMSGLEFLSRLRESKSPPRRTRTYDISSLFHGPKAGGPWETDHVQESKRPETCYEALQDLLKTIRIEMPLVDGTKERLERKDSQGESKPVTCDLSFMWQKDLQPEFGASVLSEMRKNIEIDHRRPRPFLITGS